MSVEAVTKSPQWYFHVLRCSYTEDVLGHFAMDFMGRHVAVRSLLQQLCCPGNSTGHVQSFYLVCVDAVT